MTHVFVERTYRLPLTQRDVFALAEGGGECMLMHRVEWQESLLASDGQRMFCHFVAPDAESVRTAFRQVGEAFNALWAGTLHRAPELCPANVVVERSFPEPVSLEAIQAIEDGHAWCLEAHHVRFSRTAFSADRRRMICLYQAPDAESVRLAQREAGMPLERVWAFQHLCPPES